jgi:16S rRNA (guanine527-N7)-methyltransferase
MDDKAKMNEKLNVYNSEIGPSGEFYEQLNCFYELLKEYNAKYNLTSILEEEEVFYKHFLDSAAGEFLFPQGAKVLEVGSGAGFPSMVLKIMRGDLAFTLVESVGKKSEFLKIAAEKLGLAAVEVKNERAEVLAHDLAYREKYDVVCARAVARLNTLAEYCLPFVKKDGIFVAYKSGDEEELQESKRAIGVLGGKIEQNIVYDLPKNFGKRSLVVVKKEKYTPAQYPRGNGKERKKPL